MQMLAPMAAPWLGWTSMVPSCSLFAGLGASHGLVKANLAWTYLLHACLAPTYLFS